MRVALHGFDPNVPSGPNIACSRLAAALVALGVQISRPGEICDVDLVNVASETPKRGKIVVQRLDGVWTRADQTWMNAPISATWSSAAAVIAQSSYDAVLAARTFGARDRVFVVPNGAPLRSRSAILDELRRKSAHVALASAAWHGQKRLTACVAAVAAARQNGTDACLLVLGAPDAQSAAALSEVSFVHWAGPVSPAVAAECAASADSLVHMAWRDHCPNAVVEALAAGTQVIAAGSGGTFELAVRSGGLIVPDDASAPQSVVFDYDDPPSIDCSGVSFQQLKPVFQRSWFGVERMARSYLQVFEECLG